MQTERLLTRCAFPSTLTAVSLTKQLEKTDGDDLFPGEIYLNIVEFLTTEGEALAPLMALSTTCAKLHELTKPFIWREVDVNRGGKAQMAICQSNLNLGLLVQIIKWELGPDAASSRDAIAEILPLTPNVQKCLLEINCETGTDVQAIVEPYLDVDAGTGMRPFLPNNINSCSMPIIQALGHQHMMRFVLPILYHHVWIILGKHRIHITPAEIVRTSYYTDGDMRSNGDPYLIVEITFLGFR